MIKNSLAFALFALSAATTAHAEFGPRQPSINGTGETLPKGSAEVGFASLSYGATDNLLVSIPTLPLVLGGAFSLNARYKIPLENNIRFSPDASVFSNAGLGGFGVGAKLGFDFGKTSDTKKSNASYNSFDIGAQFVSFHSAYRISTIDEEKTYAWNVSGNSITGSAEFDHYTNSGNLFYVGATGTVGPYMGFTWGFEYTHIGLVSSMATMFIPCPYIYWRF